MKEPMTDARRKQLYRIKKRKRRKQCIRVALRMAVLCFLVLFAVQKTADLLRVDDSDRMEDNLENNKSLQIVQRADSRK